MKTTSRPAGQFRVRAAPRQLDRSWPRLADEAGGESTEELVKALDPPVFEISQCEESSVNICVHELSADEMKDLVGGKVEQ